MKLETKELEFEEGNVAYLRNLGMSFVELDVTVTWPQTVRQSELRIKSYQQLKLEVNRNKGLCFLLPFPFVFSVCVFMEEGEC